MDAILARKGGMHPCYRHQRHRTRAKTPINGVLRPASAARPTILIQFAVSGFQRQATGLWQPPIIGQRTAAPHLARLRALR